VKSFPRWRDVVRFRPSTAPTPSDEPRFEGCSQGKEGMLMTTRQRDMLVSAIAGLLAVVVQIIVENHDKPSE
jgi:hypothetical protein